MRLLFTIILALIISGYASFGQLSSVAKYSTHVSYGNDTNLVDTLFVFYKPVLGSISAATPFRDYGRYTFYWTKFDTLTMNFTDTVKKDPAIDTAALSTITNLTQGYYKVTIVDSAGKDTSMHAWVFYDSISFHIDSVESTCWGIKFRVSDVKLDTIRYFSPVTKRKIEIGNPVKVKWNWKDQDDAAQEMEKSYYTFSTDPPVDTTTYVATITNAYRNTQTDSFIIYNPLATKAKYVLHDDGETYFKLDTAKPSGGAPLRVKIANDSKNGKEYQWFFKAEFQNSETTDTLCPIPPDPTRYITTDLKDTVFSIFYFPGKYIIKLVSIAKTQCDPDTFSFTSSDASETFPYTLKINKPESPVALPLPNWFKPEQERFMFNVTPEGQSLVPAEEEKTINPHSAKWDINSMSMRSMNIKIFNRWGQIVYEYEGVLETNEGDKYWEGWDGKDGNRDCDAGIYYWYIIFHSIEGVDYHDYLQGNKSRKSSSTSGTGTGTGTSGTTPTTDQSKDPKKTQNILSGYVFLIR